MFAPFVSVNATVESLSGAFPPRCPPDCTNSCQYSHNSATLAAITGSELS
jgi:hypothetical protein